MAGRRAAVGAERGWGAGAAGSPGAESGLRARKRAANGGCFCETQPGWMGLDGLTGVAFLLETRDLVSKPFLDWWFGYGFEALVLVEGGGTPPPELPNHQSQPPIGRKLTLGRSWSERITQIP